MESGKLHFGLTEEQRQRLRERGCAISGKCTVTAEMIAAFRPKLDSDMRAAAVAKRRAAILEVRVTVYELEMESLREQLDRERGPGAPSAPATAAGWSFD